MWLAAALALVVLVIVWRTRASRAGRAALIVAMIAASVALARPRHHDGVRGPQAIHDDYVGSNACAKCHASQHASWSRTYHRTMTQRAPAPYAITTGSHHMKGFWKADDSGALHMSPFVYAFDEHRIIGRSEAFLEPPDAPQADVHWETNCIACHATAGRPNRPALATVGELGIACEACHGPGAAHVAREQDPLLRWRGDRDPHIVNPKKLAPDRSTAVCGQCHAYTFPRDEEAFLARGYTGAFHPGDALDATRIILTPEVLASGRVALDTDARNLFWTDGTVRVGGREHNALVLSACYARGEGDRKITCLSCHSMHASDPDDQLRRDRTVQDACISCHKMPANHTHHAPSSSGSACVACHMPKTSYALRTAIRSHRIDSPVANGAKPNACNLCHLDRTLTWAGAELARLFPRRGSRSDIATDVPASAVGLLMADAAERVIWADAFGDPDALAASGKDWEAPLLVAASRDPYAVIRFIATRSANRLGRSDRTLVDGATIDKLVAHRDSREVYVAE